MRNIYLVYAYYLSNSNMYKYVYWEYYFVQFITINVLKYIYSKNN